MNELLVTLDDLTVAFDDRPVVDHVNLKVHRGDILTIIGPNGAGKTTLIKAVLGLQKPTRGVVSLARKLVIGYVPQHLTLESTLPLSVKRFMMLTGRSEPDCQAALSKTGVGHLFNASVHHLSGGEKQRLLLARALVRKPDLLVLDEPAQGVDINGQASLYELIRQLRDELNCGVIMISHDLHLVMAATDQVICLNQHICCSGHPADISHDPAFIETFGTQVAESLAVYHHRHNHSHDLHGDVVEDTSVASPSGHQECSGHAHH
ncbi:zinc ABC transporter ATP-binding protein ZnuC [Marinobacter sp. M216]|uniref:Zinc ABC transporter ATP-binding protein ZnuC n=1 Tax=Marinobacter albus TaxID=3030833 RepID=A0ABT7H8D6_9GAMM|nr:MULTISPECIES: zinc ABC transporter ATP-binding protein ZnuC [unclassified Marinobacter]MBW7471561.1 zinc ABC transporter ATP-binding protein ZnuC [Marinobacter sp. F4218]MDK9556160.1 zinc ABC transporter ATP-binding protein ZnuC [Marinobacter sp. M216]